ncbi:MAG: hypothetical protein M1608_16445, partial [Candidatus Omnitrophica bacterium]|nr:hypothetical protein [Candidatus Omnitrophota bacterium]
MTLAGSATSIPVVKNNEHQSGHSEGSQDGVVSRSPTLLSRRTFFWTTAGFIAASGLLRAQEPGAKPALSPGLLNRKSSVALVGGNSRRENICAALSSIEDRILPVLKTKKRVVIKPNIVNTANQLASTHVDALH